jgi:maltose alpha-D-glucosyltransferase/alpha-amylase
MQLYDRGIRRRLAPLLGNDRTRLELAFSLLFSLPGTPMMQYGDEIGMGDDLSLDEREAARTPMQWTGEPPHAGFSRAERTVRPVISDGAFGYKTVNVADQRRDPQSLLNWTERMIRMRRECPEISWGEYTILKTDPASVLVMRYDWRGVALLTGHNFDSRPHTVHVDPRVRGGEILTDVFDHHTSHAGANGAHELKLKAWGWRWFRVGAIDNALNRTLL